MYICILITKNLIIKNKKRRKIMKKLFYVLFAFIALTISAQAQTDSTKVKTIKYISVGLSINPTTNDSFEYSSYPSVEVGITRNDVSYGVVFGRGSLKGLGESQDNFTNYFYEFKMSPSVSLGFVNANLILGVGGYINGGGQNTGPDVDVEDIDTNSSFIEYGFGFSKSYGNVSYGLSYSNWDGTNYVTPSVSYAF